MRAKSKTLKNSEGIAPVVKVKSEPAPKPAGYVFGRPTTYDPSFCELAIEAGRRGKSRTWIAAEIGVTRQTVDNWSKANTDFFDALELAKAFEQRWWEDIGQSGMEQQNISAPIWSRNMAARFRSDWTERQEVSGPEGGPIQHENIDRPEKETREEWLARRQRELAATMGAAAGTTN
jgi:DNA-binding XRE family transcriptional regulator